MACITHYCVKCRRDEFNNYGGVMECPDCDEEMTSSFDEVEYEEEEETHGE